jgi:mannose-P-dolichol utilization defect 1
VIAPIVGCLARPFTTATEVGDNIVAAGFALALVLNNVLGAQMWMYWGKGEKEEANLGKAKFASVTEKERQFNVVVPPQSPMPRSSTPTGRKWARKVNCTLSHAVTIIYLAYFINSILAIFIQELLFVRYDSGS